MKISNTKESWILFLGDLFFMLIALSLTVLFRYREEFFRYQFDLHIEPFSILFLVWLLIFFIAGLYEKQTLVLKSRIPSLLLSAQIANTIIAVLFFYLIPYFGIAPKTNLFIYLILSFALLFIWRHGALQILSSRKRYKGILVGSGEDAQNLEKEINNNKRYNLTFIKVIDPSLCTGDECHFQISQAVQEGATLIVVDTHHPTIEAILPDLYKLLFSGVRFADMSHVYEEIFDRVPISLIKHSWFLEHLTHSKRTYDILKRLIDMAISLVCGIVSLIVYPLVCLAIKLEDRGPLFYKAERVGQDGKVIHIIKFRTMTSRDTPEEALKTRAVPTKVGIFLRKTRIDELPQFWNILRGDISLVGPRPEIPTIADHYAQEIPYYNVRHLIKPGASGWAQMYGEHAHHGPSIKETQNKLSYDLYYVKNRSIVLDIKVALKTLRMFFTRAGK